MARQGKQGIDYFSHDVHSCSDRKLKLLMAKHKVIGYGVFFLLLQDLYKEGYSLKLDEDYILLFVSDHHLEEEQFDCILLDCLKFGLFDIGIYESFNILTSKRTQDNFLEAIKRRKDVLIEKDTWLLSLDDLPKNIKVIGVDPKPEKKEVPKKAEPKEPKKPKTPKPPEEPKEEKLKFHKNAISHIPEYLNNKEFFNAFDEWDKMRIKKRCADSDRRYKQIFREINEFGGMDLEKAIKVVNRSSDKGYTDLYSLDGNGAKKKVPANNKKKVANVPTEVVDLRGKL